jgi:hypothetical protein
VGDGWQWIVEMLYRATEKTPCCSVSQVKEKFGTLCFYLDHDYTHSYEGDECEDYERLYTAISLCEKLSSHFCEVCGAIGRLRGRDEGRSWVRTLCDDCAKT